MKTAGQKVVSIILSIALIIGTIIIVCPPLTAMAITENEVITRLENCKTTYVNGGVWCGTYYANNGSEGPWECFGFACEIFRMLYDCEMPRSYTGSTYNGATRYYKLVVNQYSNVTEVGSLSPGSYNAVQMRALLSQAKAGYVIQAANSRSQHTMIVNYVTDYGISVYDANSDGRNGIRADASYSWEEFYNWRPYGVSLYKYIYYDDTPSAARIDINPNGGTAQNSFYVNYGEKCNLTNDSARRAGYKLSGWNLYRPADEKWFVGGIGWCTSSEISANGYEKCLYAPNLSMTLDSSWYSNCSTTVSSFTFYAVWKEATYTININANGGTAITSSLSLKYNQICNLSPDYVQRDGYELAGWNLYRPADGKWFVGGIGWRTDSEISANGYKKSQYAPNLSMTLDGSWFTNCSTTVSSFTFYAVWKEAIVTVKFNGNGATSGSMSDQVFSYNADQALSENEFERKYTVTYACDGVLVGGSALTATATATFNGWATSANGEIIYDDKQIVKNLANSGTVNLYANWTLGTVTLPIAIKSGYTFGGWYADEDLTFFVGAADDNYIPFEDKTLYARWIEKEEEAAPYWGDLNGDKYVDAEDCSLLLNYIKGISVLTEEQICFADVDLNGIVNTTDYTILMKYISGNGSIKAKSESSFILNNRKSTYFVDDSFDTNSVSLRVLNNNDAAIKHTLTDSFNIIRFDSSTTGEKVVIIEYRDMLFYTTVTVVERAPMPTITPAEGSVINEKTHFIYGLSAGAVQGCVAVTDGTAAYEYPTAKQAMGTGTKVNVYNNDQQLVDSYTIVVFGDIDGDGWYDGTDAYFVSLVANGLIPQTALSAAQRAACDANHDGVTDEADVSIIEQAGLLLAQVDQTAPIEELQANSVYLEYCGLIDQNIEIIEPDQQTAVDEPQPTTQTVWGWIKALFTIVLNWLLRVF